MIEDGYDDYNKLYKEEQSDIVLIMLNLAFIPDNVIKNLDFSQPGWSKNFKQDMENYKLEFNGNKKRICDWCF